MNVEFAKFSSDRDDETERRQLEEAYRGEEAVSESSYEEDTKDLLQKPRGKLLLATPQLLLIAEESCETQTETVTMSEMSTAVEFQLHDETRDTASEEQSEKTTVHGDVEFTDLTEVTEHVAIDYTDEGTKELQQDILLQEKQTIEMVEKAVDECEDLTTTLPQLMTLETDNLEEETYALELLNLDDLSKLQISGESFSKDESITVNVVTQQLTHGSLMLHLGEEMEFILPMVTGIEEAVEEIASSSVEADKSAEAEKEIGTLTKTGQQVREDLDVSTQPEVQFDLAISTVTPDVRESESVEPPDERTSEEIQSCEPQLHVEEEKIKQQLEKLFAAEEDLTQGQDTSLKSTAAESPEDSEVLQPSVTVESLPPLVHALDETCSFVVEVEKEAFMCVPEMTVGPATDEMLIREKVVKLQVEVEVGATTKEAEVEVSVIQTEKVEKPAEAEKADHLQREIIAIDHLPEAETLATTGKEETTRVVQYTETTYDDETRTAFEIRLPTNEDDFTHPITDTKVEACDKYIETVQSERDEAVAEETRPTKLHVDSQFISPVKVEMMLPVKEYDTALVVSDIETVIRVEEDEIQKQLHDEILLKTKDDVNEAADEVYITMCSIRQEVGEEFHEEVQMEAEHIENADSTTSPAAAETATALAHRIVTERPADAIQDESGLKTTAASTQQQIMKLLTRTEERDDIAIRQERHEQNVSRELKAQQLVREDSEMATTESTQAVETLAVSAEELQVEISALQLEFKDIEDVGIVAESDIEVVDRQTAGNEFGTVSIDVQKAVLLTPQIIEGEAVITNILPDKETENEEQEGKVIEILRPAVHKKEIATSDSKQSVPDEEKIEIYMKKDAADIELTTACRSEETTLEQLLKEASDVETDTQRETMKPISEEATAAAVVFSSPAEHKTDLIVFQHAFDFQEDARIGADEETIKHSNFEDEIIGELSEVDVTHREKKTEFCLVPLTAEEATTQHVEIKSETESSLLAAVSAASTSVLQTTDKQQEVTKDVRYLHPEIEDTATEVATVTHSVTTPMPAESEGLRESTVARESMATMQFSHAYEFSETEVSHIVFPSLTTDDSVSDAASAAKASVCDDTTHDVLDDDNLRFHKASETPFQTDAVTEKMPAAMDVMRSVLEDVQPELFVPYTSSVIVHSSDVRAQTDAIVSERSVDKCIVDSLHITEIHLSEHDELTSILNEELLCDNITIVFPENVESSLPSDQPESEIVDLPQQSYVFDSKEDELPKNDDMEQMLCQLQNATVESMAVQMRLSEEGDTLTVRPKKPEFSDIISVKEKQADGKNVEELLAEEDVTIRDPLQEVCSNDVHPLKTDVQDSEILRDTLLASSECSYVCEKGDDVLLDRTATEKYWECDKPGESEEDLVQLSTLQISLCDGTLVHIVREEEVFDAYEFDTMPVVENVHDEVDTLHTEEVVKLVTSDLVDDNVHIDGPENSEDGQTPDAVRASENDNQVLELVHMDRTTTSSSLELLGNVQSQQFEASLLIETLTDQTEVSDCSHIETLSRENEREVEKQATSFEVRKLTDVDRKESEANKVCASVIEKQTSYELTADDSQHHQPESIKTEESYTAVQEVEHEVESLVDLPWSTLFAGLLDDDSCTSVAVSDDINKEDAGLEGTEASDEESEKRTELPAVTDDKPVASLAASKSSLVTRRVQRVSADGRVIERVKSEEVPMSFGSESITPYLFGCDLPSPPDFSPQSDDRQSSASSIKVYTDTVKGEPWTERRVEEVQETQPDGSTVTRKVVRVRKRRTIIKHIVIEGPEFEEMILDEPEKVATTNEVLSAKVSEALNVEGDFQSCVDRQLELFASECKPTPPKSDTDSAPTQLPVEGDIAARSEDFSYTGPSIDTETDSTQSVDKLCTSIKDKSSECALDRDYDADKDSTSSLPQQQASREMPVSAADFGHARVSSQLSFLGEARRSGESACFPLDFEHDVSCSVVDGTGLDNVESASSCGDFATGILRYSHA